MEDDIPPLEDMSCKFTNSLTIRNQNRPCQSKREYLEPLLSQETKREEQVKEMFSGKSAQTEEATQLRVKKPQHSSNYCGFKKGFLVQKHEQSNKKKVCQIDKPFVKKQKDLNRNVLPEVQDAINSQIPKLQGTDWVTDDLLTKITNHPKLSLQFADPRFSNAIAEFQANPQKAMMMYQKDPELREFIQEFCAIMGDHFTNLSDNIEMKQPGKKTSYLHPDLKLQAFRSESVEDETKIRKILADPEISAILGKAEVRSLFHTIRQEPEKVDRILATCSLELRYNIQRLIDAGLLSFSTGY